MKIMFVMILFMVTFISGSLGAPSGRVKRAPKPVMPTASMPVVPTASVPVVPTASVPVVPTASVPVVPTASVPVVPTMKPAYPSEQKEIPSTKLKTWAPLPEVAKSPENLPGKSYYTGKVADDVYWVTKDGYNSMFIVTTNGVVVVDSPPFFGQDLPAAIKDVTSLPVTHLIYSHSHSDHIGGATIFQNVQIIAHSQTAKILEKRNDPQRPVPTKIFSGSSMTLHIGGKIIQLDYKGPIHQPGNIFIWLPKEKTIWSCDIINPGWAAFTRLGVAEDTVAYLEATDIILAYPFQHFVPCHWGKLGDRQDVLNHKEYINDVQKNAIIGQAAMNISAVASQVEDPTNFGLIVELAFRAQIAKCAELTTAKWITRLGGVDIYTESNCDAISMAQDIDYGRNVIGGETVPKTGC